MKRRELLSKLFGVAAAGVASVSYAETEREPQPFLHLPNSYPCCPLCGYAMGIQPSSGGYPFKPGDVMVAIHGKWDSHSCPNDDKVFEIPFAMWKEYQPKKSQT